jgi:AGCS family alanine or glycine:cation symporter
METETTDLSLLDRFHELVLDMGDIVWGWPFLILLIGTGVYLTLRLRFVQVREMKHSVEVIAGRYDDPNEKGDLSHFQALSSALSATIGIGNIAGVAYGIYFGGPGALFWMWVTASVGMATKGVECYLAHRFRIIHPDGSASGGPMYYITRGMGSKWKWLGVGFAFLAAFASLGSADMVQANTVSQIFEKDLNIPPWATGAFMAFMVAIVIIGGIRRIGQVASRLVPTMCVIYVIGGIIVLVLRADALPHAFELIFTKAFTPQAEIGGFAGTTFLLTLKWGFKRGLFSNEAGQGSAPIAHAAAKTNESVREGIVAQIGPFVDTLLVCSLTGLVILVTDAWYMGLDENGQLLNGAALTAWAFKEGLAPITSYGHLIVTFAVLPFAYSTMISWSYYGDRCVTYLWGRGAVMPYRIIFVIFTFIGSTLTLQLVWDMADISNGLMAAPNLIALIFLAGVAKRDYDDYFARQNRWKAMKS